MVVGKRILAAITVLLSVTGFLLGIAGGVGVWVVKGTVTTKATYVFERIDTKLNIADDGLDHVKTSLARAAERLESVREEQRKIAEQPAGLGAAMRGRMARTMQQTVAPGFSEAHEKLHDVAEAAVVVNAILEDIGSFPLFSATGFELGDLTAMNNGLSQVESSAWELGRLLNSSGSGPDADAEANLSRIERTLESVRGLIAAYEPKLKLIRQRTEQMKTMTLGWITPAAAIISFVFFWIALSQISLLLHACSWWRSER